MHSYGAIGRNSPTRQVGIHPQDRCRFGKCKILGEPVNPYTRGCEAIKRCRSENEFEVGSENKYELRPD